MSLEDKNIQVKVDLSDERLDNIDFVKYIINLSPDNFKLASDRLKDNEEISKLAVEKDINNFKYVSDRLKSDIEFIGFVSSIIVNKSDADSEVKELVKVILSATPEKQKEIFEKIEDSQTALNDLKNKFEATKMKLKK